MKKSIIFLYIDVVLFFLLIFGFYITPFINSSLLVPIIIIFLNLLNKNRFNSIILNFISNKNIITIIFFFLFSVLIATCIPILHQTFDFSYIANFASQLIQLVCIIFFISFILCHKKEKISDYFEKVLIYAFLAQSIIQILSFLFSSFANFIHIFYLDYEIINLYERSGKIRGLALASSTGWGLSVGYACTFLFFTKHYLISKKINFFTLLLGLTLFIGCFFSGRTAFVGVLLSLVYYFISEKKGKFKDFIYVLSFFILITFFFLTFMQLYNSQIIDKLINFAFEPIVNYFNSGKLETSSTNTLLNMWDREFTLETYIFGDGLFTDPTSGKYYMLTDVGYLRNLFYGGIFWILIIAFYHIIISGLLMKKKSQKKQNILIIFLLIFSFLIEFKAMSLGFNKYLFTILLTYYLSIIADNYTNRIYQND
ncbi:hypothetical protein [Proteus mirabilis]|uniref:hypothetical protein n=1 Tax=Proteus mirabilis TaxID=584 RepID=UPI001A29FD0D|nr:hypothetical protein [Proteus mirabilis]MBI6254598.1 hypothetical protein [Proteus mirabilis]MBI6517997.1 hypothetical protein [Proteus mirabilis]MCL8616652.1 hypothetical protein [Proteus mirabilis]MDC6030917.1 hypothetical protein [Proteus mirabilis]MDC6047857.1 hypothetical protein [Proteus mirabilis]